MDASILPLLRSPRNLLPLTLTGDELVAEDGQRFLIEDGIPDLRRITSSTAWQGFYDRAAIAYDATLNLGIRLGLGSEEKVRAELLTGLAQASDLVVDVGCGTGSNRVAFGSEARYLGIDLSRGMLLRAARKTAQAGSRATFVQAQAEELPIASQAADLVVAMGVIQHVKHASQAIAELARIVTQTGKILLIDEKRSLASVTKAVSGKKIGLNQWSSWIAIQHGLLIKRQGEIGEYYFLSFSKSGRTKT